MLFQFLFYLLQYTIVHFHRAFTQSPAEKMENLSAIWFLVEELAKIRRNVMPIKKVMVVVISLFLYLLQSFIDGFDIIAENYRRRFILACQIEKEFENLFQ